MEKVKIEYEKYNVRDLLETWNTGDKDELKELQQTTYKFNVNELLQDDEKLESFETNYLNQIIELAKKCDLEFCYQCSMFVDNSYIQHAQQCIECAIGNGF